MKSEPKSSTGISKLSRFLDQPRTWAVFMAAGALMALLLLLFGDPSNPHSFFPPCVVHEITGWNCPGCGITRSLYALVHGQIGQAFRHNAVGFPILLLAGVVLAKPWWIALTENKWRPPVLFKGAAWVLLAAGLLWMIIRNLMGV